MNVRRPIIGLPGTSRNRDSRRGGLLYAGETSPVAAGGHRL